MLRKIWTQPNFFFQRIFFTRYLKKIQSRWAGLLCLRVARVLTSMKNIADLKLKSKTFAYEYCVQLGILKLFREDWWTGLLCYKVARVLTPIKRYYIYKIEKETLYLPVNIIYDLPWCYSDENPCCFQTCRRSCIYQWVGVGTQTCCWWVWRPSWTRSSVFHSSNGARSRSCPSR